MFNKKSFLLLICISAFLFPQKKVYLILGSDTAVWEGMSTNKYVCHFDLSVIPDVTRNFYAAMQPAYRNTFHDSYGGSVKFTWWLLGGSMYKPGDNHNVPYANTFVPWVAKKYYGSRFTQFGDELTLHYHTYFWSDYDRDGLYFWNQAKSFAEYRNDFDNTMAQYLLEENIYPVSFRAGWNFMDTDWQNYIDKWFPYSMHNQYPGVGRDTVEPLGGLCDWSKCSAEFVPFHPSAANYQLPGNLKGYDLRSIYNGSVTQSTMNTVFSKANNGVDQVMCIWGHVWDDIYLTAMQKIDTLAHKAAAQYPAVQFKYCTAVEAMQLWRRDADTTAPQISFNGEQTGDSVRFTIASNEPIFQEQPFVAVKDIYEQYYRLDCINSGGGLWRTARSFPRRLLAKAGTAVLDTSGNLATRIINYLPNDIYIDDESSGFECRRGNWANASTDTWGMTSKKCVLGAADTAVVRWNITVPETGLYNIYLQSPKSTAPCNSTSVRIIAADTLAASRAFGSGFIFNNWQYAGTVRLSPASNAYVELSAVGSFNNGKTLTADVVKISALVKQKELYLPQTVFNPAAICVNDTLTLRVAVANHGIDSMSITGMASTQGIIRPVSAIPLNLAPMSESAITISFTAPLRGSYNDTLLIYSTDPGNPITRAAFTFTTEEYFAVVDNADSGRYNETGVWSFSNAYAYGVNSRYAGLSQTPKPTAVFNVTLKESRNYDVSAIVPATQNASPNALYIIRQNGVHIDSVYQNQNTGSGSWSRLGTYALKAGLPTTVTIADAQTTGITGVLRADAVRFASHIEAARINDAGDAARPETAVLEQNYPNPFNSETIIRFSIASRLRITLQVFDVLGRERATLANEERAAGEHTISWNASGLPSGVYFLQLQAGRSRVLKKIVYLK